MSLSTIRRLAPDSRIEAGPWQAIRQLCCRTGDNGRPIAPERWDFFPKIWIDPYEKLLPQWTYVAEADRVVAYLTGCPDTATFARKRFFQCTLPLLAEIVGRSRRLSPDARRFVRWALGLEKKAEFHFPPEIRREIKRRYPAHLHMNVDAPWRGAGVGTRLIGQCLSDLRSAGVPGIHLYCGPDPREFYLRRGFQELGKILFHGTPVYALGLSLSN